MIPPKQALWTIFVLCSLCAAPQAAFAQAEPVFLLHTQRAQIDVVERFSRTIELPDPIESISDFDPAVIDVRAESNREVTVTAVGPGVTSATFVDVNGVIRELEVFVKGDTRHLQAYLRELFPDSAVRAIRVGETVVLRGWVTQPSHITDIMDVAREFYPEPLNQMRVAAVDRVMMKVKIMEVNRTKLRQFGFDWFISGSSASFGQQTGALFGPATLVDANGLATLGARIGESAGTNLAFQFTAGGGNYLGFIQALQNDSIARVLAEPTLVAMSGRPATMLSGGEFPVLVPQGVGATSIEFREFGVRMEAIPVVLGNGRVRLDIAPEVSDRDFSSAVVVGGTQVPGLSTRRVNTQVEMNYGETLVLSGLIQRQNVTSIAKVPFLGELPWIGAAFSAKRSEELERELLIIVTPYPASPIRPEQGVPCGPGENSSVPTDAELYFHNTIELPNYGDPCNNCSTGPYGIGACGTGGCGTGSCGDAGCTSCGPTTVGHPGTYVTPQHLQQAGPEMGGPHEMNAPQMSAPPAAADGIPRPVLMEQASAAKTPARSQALPSPSRRFSRFRPGRTDSDNGEASSVARTGATVAPPQASRPAARGGAVRQVSFRNE